MEHETFLTELADEMVDLIEKFHTLAGGRSITPDTAVLCRGIIEELIIMESLFPEITRIDSPSSALKNLMSHLGDGALHSRYPLAIKGYMSGLLGTVLGDGPGCFVVGTLSLIDVYYVEGVLIKAHLRDGNCPKNVWTDVTNYAEVMLPKEVSSKITIRLTVSLNVIPGAADSYSTMVSKLCCDGAVLATLKELYKPDDQGVFVRHRVKSVKWAEELPTFELILVEASGPFNCESDFPQLEFRKRYYAFPENVIAAVNSDVFLRNIKFPVYYIRSDFGQNCILIPDSEVSTLVTVTEVECLNRVDGAIEATVHIKPYDNPGTTVIAPFWKSFTSLVTYDSCYMPGDLIDFKQLLDEGSGKPSRFEFPTNPRNMYNLCPSCGEQTRRRFSIVVCVNQRCPGVVAARLYQLSNMEDGLALLPFVDISRCQTVVALLSSGNAGVTIVDVLTELRKFAVLDNEMVLTDRGTRHAIDEALTFLDDSMTSDYMRPACWRFTRAIVHALGFSTLSDISLSKIIRAAQARMEPPFPYIAVALQDTGILLRIGVFTEVAAYIATEAQSRRDELDALCAYFSSPPQDKMDTIATIVADAGIDPDGPFTIGRF